MSVIQDVEFLHILALSPERRKSRGVAEKDDRRAGLGPPLFRCWDEGQG